MADILNNISKRKEARYRLKRNSILFRTVMLSWLIIILTLVVFVFSVIPHQKNSLIKSLEATAEVISSSLEQVTTTALVAEDYSFVVDYCMKVVTDRPFILYLVITRQDGFSFVFAGERWSQQELSGFWRPSPAAYGKGKFIKSGLVGKEVFHYSYPFVYSGINWGWVHIGLSPETFFRELKTTYFHTLLLALLCIAGGLVLSYFFAKRLSQPILSLNEITQRIRDGDLSVRAEISSGDEVEELATSFNLMTESLHKTQEGLLESQRRFHDVAENMGDWVWEMDKEGKYTYSNPVVEKVLRYKPQEVIGRYFYEFFHPEDREDLKEDAFRIFRRKGIFKNLINRTIRKDGRCVIIETNGAPILSKDGQLLGYRGAARDITEQIEAQRALRESDNRYRLVTETALEGIYEVDIHGNFVFINDAYAKILGYRTRELLGRHFTMIIPELKISEALKITEDAVLGKHRAGEFNLKHAQGYEVPVFFSMGPMIKEGRSVGFAGIIQDITMRKKAERALQEAYNQLKETQTQLIQAEKLRAVGTMASGVAHEVKNPLGIILQGLDYLKKYLPMEKAQISEVFQAVRNSVDRANKIINTLLDFSRESELKMKQEDVNTILENSFSLIQHVVNKANIKVFKDLREDLPKVSLDKGKIEQVFINLILNAIHAMDKGGTIILRTYLTELKEGRRVEDYFVHGEAAVVIEVEDTGIGISRENLKKIFVPFFSTKGPRGGTGLGLYIVKNIVEMHDGILRIESKEGKGTKVIIILKIFEEKEGGE